MTERNRELFALIPAALLVTAGFAAVFVQRDDVVTDASLTYGGVFLGLCFVAHLIVRMTLPHDARFGAHAVREFVLHPTQPLVQVRQWIETLYERTGAGERAAEYFASLPRP